MAIDPARIEAAVGELLAAIGEEPTRRAEVMTLIGGSAQAGAPA